MSRLRTARRRARARASGTTQQATGVPPSSSGSSLARLLCSLGLCTAFLLVAAWQMWPHLLDDGYIFLSYARNLVRGEGFVYQGGERVDGQSNPLWVLLLAVGGSTGADWVQVSKVLGLVLALATLGATFLIARALVQDGSQRRADLAAFLGTALLAASPGFGFYAVTGLGTTLTTLLVTLGVGWHLLDMNGDRPARARCYVPLALLGLTRPEAPMVLAFVHAHRLRRAHGTPGMRREFLIGGLAWGPLALLFVWRWAYFGSPLPNTFYAKPGTLLDNPAGAFSAMGKLLGGFGELFWLVFAATCFAGLTRVGLARRTGFALAVIASFLVFALYTGGDWMPHGRFIQPALPLVAVVCAMGWSRLGGVARLLCAWLLIAAAGVQAHKSVAFWSDLDGNSVYDHALSSRNNVAMARWLSENIEPGATLLTDEIGALGFYSGLRILDQWGIVDPEVARLFHQRRFNPYATSPESSLRREVQQQVAEQLLARSPDFVTIDYRAPIGPGDVPDPSWVLPITMAELFEGIQAGYRFRRAFPLMADPPKALLLYERTGGGPDR